MVASGRARPTATSRGRPQARWRTAAASHATSDPGDSHDRGRVQPPDEAPVEVVDRSAQDHDAAAAHPGGNVGPVPGHDHQLEDRLVIARPDHPHLGRPEVDGLAQVRRGRHPHPHRPPPRQPGGVELDVGHHGRSRRRHPPERGQRPPCPTPAGGRRARPTRPRPACRDDRRPRLDQHRLQAGDVGQVRGRPPGRCPARLERRRQPLGGRLRREVRGQVAGGGQDAARHPGGVDDRRGHTTSFSNSATVGMGSSG